MKKQEYLDLKKQHEKEVADFPVAYAFNDKQLVEALEKLGAKSVSECVTVLGQGDVVKKTDAKRFITMLKQQVIDLKTKMIEDDAFAEAAFLYEMDNHEYMINHSGDEDVLRCFAMNEDELVELGLLDAYRKARKQHIKNAYEEGEL